MCPHLERQIQRVWLLEHGFKGEAKDTCSLRQFFDSWRRMLSIIYSAGKPIQNVASDVRISVVCTMDIPWKLTKELIGTASLLAVVMVDIMEESVIENQLATESVTPS